MASSRKIPTDRRALAGVEYGVMDMRTFEKKRIGKEEEEEELMTSRKPAPRNEWPVITRHQ